MSIHKRQQFHLTTADFRPKTLLFRTRQVRIIIIIIRLSYQLPDTAGSFWTKVGGECRRMEEPAGCAMPTRLNGTQE